MSTRSHQLNPIKLEQQFADGHFSRREFIRQLTTLGALGTIVPSFALVEAHAAEPRQGGHFRCAIANGGTTDKLDPASTVSEFMIHLNYGIRNHLTEINSQNKLVGELAESFEPARGTKSWVFKLRRGVEFHNGKTMDARDVVDSIEYHHSEDSTSGGKQLLDEVEDVHADGKYTVIFNLKRGNADFPYVLFDYHFAILPSDGDGNLDWRSGVGTGGYVLQDFEPGVRASFERFPNYWKDGTAHFDTVELLLVQDVAARSNSLMTGEVHAMDECDLKTVHRLEAHPDVVVDEVTTSQHVSAPMNTTVPPFDDNNVRLALKYAIDRQAYLDTVVRGHGTIGNDHPISATMPYYADDIPQRTYDPEKARHHLKKAGYDSLDLELYTAPIFSGAIDGAVLYKEHAGKAGIRIKVIQQPADGFWSNVWMKRPWTHIYWGARPTPDLMFSTIYGSDSPWNDTYWKHKHFNELLLNARSQLDETRRHEIYREMQLLVRNEGGSVIPLFNNHVFARRSNVRHTKGLASYRALDGHKAMERWWFA